MKILNIILAIFFFVALVENGMEIIKKPRLETMDIMIMIILILSEVTFIGNI